MEQKKKLKEGKTVKIDDYLTKQTAEEKDDLTTLFAVRTTINQESNILRQIFYRFKIL
ncbi:hypothetical protein LCGC14_2783670, partial [marine sediment metagenome]